MRHTHAGSALAISGALLLSVLVSGAALAESVTVCLPASLEQALVDLPEKHPGLKLLDADETYDLVARAAECAYWLETFEEVSRKVHGPTDDTP